jgi:hypothetical protein
LKDIALKKYNGRGEMSNIIEVITEKEELQAFSSWK